MIEEDRLELLEVAIVVGVVDRHPVLEQRQPAHVIAARQARSADRDAHLLPVTRLDIDAGRESARIAQADVRLEIGRESFRESVRQYGEILMVAATLKKTTKNKT